MAIYKHVSTYLRHDGKMEARIPSCRHKQQEDDVTPRVCVAPTLEDCLTAIPNGGSHLDELNIQQRGYFFVFTIDTEKIGISEEDIISSKTLYEKDFVRDSDITNEVWITKSFQVPPEDIQLIKLTDWDEAVHDILPHSIYEIADKEYDGDYLTAYQDIYQEFVPSSIGIENAQYMTENLAEEEEVSFYMDDELEFEAILSYVDDMGDVEITEEYTDEITIQAKKDVNLKRLFLHHATIAGLMD